MSIDTYDSKRSPRCYEYIDRTELPPTQEEEKTEGKIASYTHIGPFNPKQLISFSHRRLMIHKSGHLRAHQPTAALGAREVSSRLNRSEMH